MAALLISIAVAAGTMLVMSALFWGRRDRRSEEIGASGELSAAQRRHLYRRLRINPNSLARQGPPPLAWLHSKRSGRPRTDA